jgi:hypothetical protein
MKLYEVPRRTWVRPVTDPTIPPGAPDVKANEPVFFHHCDGMYSFCHNEQDDIVHLAAWTEVEILDDR